MDTIKRLSFNFPIFMRQRTCFNGDYEQKQQENASTGGTSNRGVYPVTPGACTAHCPSVLVATTFSVSSLQWHFCGVYKF